ncbi:hypothetical protein BDZ94DRAFT_1336099 [Collybia nuda]|uniref:TPX2 C-terminal domain-containing protein n=1 Tax=Collybia nuda TaxID=64659 RepID=A0A9P6CDD5_9AGAR|nr:hypothetical protein BDZ94DRAFT_1336099 [Collybia nuda]
MPPSFDELSLRHLPDISNSSFSFQIPSTSTGDLLLANSNDDDDFFQNADDTISTPGPSRTISQQPLTLSELTPKVQSRAYQAPQGESSPPHDRPPPKQNPRGLGKATQARTVLPRAAKASQQPPSKTVTQIDELRGPEASPRAVRLRTLRAEVDSLSDNSRESAIPSSSSSSNHEHPTEEDQPISSKKEKITARPKQVVYSGGISKVRSKPGPFSARTIPSASQSQTQTSQALAQLVPHASTSKHVEIEENPDLSVCSTTSGGVAERLVMYSQKLIGSFGLFNTDNDNNKVLSPQETGGGDVISPGSRKPKSYHSIETNDNANEQVGLQGDHTGSNEDPFTLSQISPPKPEHLPRPVSPATTPASPMRPSRKRPGSVASSHQPNHKKGKMAPATDIPPYASDNLITEKPLAGGSLLRSGSGSGSGRARPVPPPTKAKGVAKKKAVRQGPATRLGTRTRESRLASSLTSSSSSATLRTSRGDNKQAKPGRSAHVDDRAAGGLPEAGSVRVAGGGHDADTDVVDAQRDTRVVLPPVNPTRPVGFKFQLDARMEARKAEPSHEHKKEKEKEEEHEKPGLGTLPKRPPHAHAHTQTHTYTHHPIPDYKSLHAQLDAELAQRKENIQPVIPRAIELSTDTRAREREKFDMRVREKEREMERVREERRREREEEEEREVREMRRRAVPRAHEVPDWYREAPKRDRRRDRREGADVDVDVGVTGEV